MGQKGDFSAEKFHPRVKAIAHAQWKLKQTEHMQ
jgi:hypothetical protein